MLSKMEFIDHRFPLLEQSNCSKSMGDTTVQEGPYLRSTRAALICPRENIWQHGEGDRRSPAGHIVVDQRSSFASLAAYRDGSGWPSRGIRRFDNSRGRQGKGSQEADEEGVAPTGHGPPGQSVAQGSSSGLRPSAIMHADEGGGAATARRPAAPQRAAGPSRRTCSGVRAARAVGGFMTVSPSSCRPYPSMIGRHQVRVVVWFWSGLRRKQID
jgi:hypothetical protein